MRDHFLPFAPPCVGDEEIEEVVAALRSDWITTGPRTQTFERQFSEFIGAKGALALSSCTGALHVSLAALGIERGDRVITSPMTFCSTVHVIEHLGAEPIFADVEADTLNLDPERVSEILAHSTGPIKALLPVHLYGHPADMGRFEAIARAHDLAIVEDAAHALPAKYDGALLGASQPADAPRRLTCFSFYATKNMTTAEGGMLTGEPDLLDEARLWSLHGMSRDAWKRYDGASRWYYEVTRPGFKYNMTDVQSAMGIHQLRKLPRFHDRRREIARRYNEAFAAYDELQLPAERPEVEHAWHIYALRLNLEDLSISRDQFIEELRDRRIGSSVHFIPVHMQPYYQNKYGYRPEDFPVCSSEFHRLVSLPLHPRLSDEDADDVIEAVTDIVRRNRRKVLVPISARGSDFDMNPEVKRSFRIVSKK
ncbi:MAG: DegT/DnrJ/EryC1/StrS family aminotransferase [Vicinamibacteria bacterium]